MNMPYMVLIVFSAFSMNLVLQCGLGLKGVAMSKNPGHISNLIKLAIVFVSIILLWTLFSRIISLTNSGIFIYALLFPISYIIYEGLEFLVFNYLLKKDNEKENSISFSGGIIAVAVLICLNIANNFLEALFLAFGFFAGTYLVFIIIGEIRRRAVLEAVPKFIRGKPLVLISLGMLSLIFTMASILIFEMIGSR